VNRLKSITRKPVACINNVERVGSSLGFAILMELVYVLTWIDNHCCLLNVYFKDLQVLGDKEEVYFRYI